MGVSDDIFKRKLLTYCNYEPRLANHFLKRKRKSRAAENVFTFSVDATIVLAWIFVLAGVHIGESEWQVFLYGITAIISVVLGRPTCGCSRECRTLEALVVDYLPNLTRLAASSP